MTAAPQRPLNLWLLPAPTSMLPALPSTLPALFSMIAVLVISATAGAAPSTPTAPAIPPDAATGESNTGDVAPAPGTAATPVTPPPVTPSPVTPAPAAGSGDPQDVTPPLESAPADPPPSSPAETPTAGDLAGAAPAPTEAEPAPGAIPRTPKTPLAPVDGDIPVPSSKPPKSDATAKASTATGNGRPEGWQSKLSVGTTGSFSHASSVVGTTDGATLQVGLALDGAFSLRRGLHTWLNEVKLRHTQTRTPQIDGFVKSADAAEVATSWSWRLPKAPAMGPYLAAKVGTQLFEGQVVRPAPFDVRRIWRDGHVDDQHVVGNGRLVVSQPFEPLQINEGAGLAADIADGKFLNLETRFGAGVQHVVAADGFAVSDNKKTPQLELEQFETSTQAGAEVEVRGKGAVSRHLAWNLKAGLLYPMVTTSQRKPVGFEAMTTEVSGTVSLKLSKRTSLDYILQVKRIPQVVDDWQIQNGLMLRAGLDVF